jgi:hypothetical protein
MSSDTATQTQTSTSSPRGNTRKGGNRSRGGSRRSPRNVPAGGKGPQAQSVTPMSSTTDSALTTEETATTASDEIQAKDEEPVCWICAEPVKYYCVSECNHRTCHVCALRLRALYKKMDCTFCKVRARLLGTRMSWIAFVWFLIDTCRTPNNLLFSLYHPTRYSHPSLPTLSHTKILDSQYFSSRQK